MPALTCVRSLELDIPARDMDFEKAMMFLVSKSAKAPQRCGRAEQHEHATRPRVGTA